MSAPPVKNIGKYEVIEVLGRGGMGLVYRAFDRQLNRAVAIKTVTEAFAGDQEMLQRFYREAAKTGALRHPNIVIVYDLGEQDGFPYIVMEYLSGDPLDRIIQSGKPQPLASKLRIIEQVCYALGYAHRNDVIHRDVKPANVIVQSDGLVKLLDFGIARQEKTDHRLTQTGHVIGTVHYMAPERLKNTAFDGRSDIFSVGVVLFQLLTGQLPFTGDYNVAQKILSEPHPSLSLFLEKYPPALDAILDRSLAKNPDDRYATADEMAAEIASIAQELRKEQVDEWMQRAQRLVQTDDLTTARDILLEVLKYDSRHVEARQLLSQVQQSLSLRQRAEQIRQLRAQADEAIIERRYDEAVQCLEAACGLDRSNAELVELLEATRQRKERRETIDGYLRQAESARESGDFERAAASLEKALQVDHEDSQVRAAQIKLARSVEEMAQRAKARTFLDIARKEIAARHFTAAIEALDEVGRIDPSNPELITLQAAAKSGHDQEQRRRILEQLHDEVSVASTTEELTRAAQMVDQALEKLPADPSLIKFKGDLARKLRDEEIRRRIDEVAVRCRSLIDTSPDEALRLIHQVLHDVPGNERLLALQSTIVAHIAERSQQQARSNFLTSAHQALSAGRYVEALRLLESCEKESGSSPEIAELIDFARQEAGRGLQSAEIQELLRRSQDLMLRADYSGVVQLLAPVERQPEAASLMFLLEDARARLEAIQQNVNAALQAAGALASHERFADAVRVLEAQPPSVLDAIPVQQALQNFRQASSNELAALRSVGSAYAVLDRGELRADTLQNTSVDSSLLERIVPIFASRRKTAADRQLSSAIEQARAAIEAGDRKQAAQTLESVVALSEFASDGLQEEWQALSRKVKGGIFKKS